VKKRRNKPHPIPGTPPQPSAPPEPAPPPAAPEIAPETAPAAPSASVEEIAAAVMSGAPTPTEKKPVPLVPTTPVSDYRSTPSREVETVSDWWRFTGLLGGFLLFFGAAMWLWNVVEMGMRAGELVEARTEYEKADQNLMTTGRNAPNPQRDPRVQQAYVNRQMVAERVIKLEESARKERFAFVTVWIILGYFLLLVHALRERHTPLGRMYGLIGLGMMGFGALYTAYIVGAQGYGMIGIGILAASAIGLLMLGLFLQPLVQRSDNPDEETGEREFADLVYKAGLGGLALVFMGVLAYLVHDWLMIYLKQILQLKEGSLLTFGLLPTGLIWLGLGLGLILVHTATERQSAWRQAVLWPMAALGLVAALGGLGTVFSDWLGKEVLVMPYGVVFGLVGLLMLWAALSRWEEGEFRRKASWGLFWLGAAFFLLAAIRSLVPAVREHFYQQYDVVGYMVPGGFPLMVLAALYMLLGWGMASDNRLVSLTRRELAGLFHSPIAYICMAGLGLVGWLSYYWWISLIFLGGQTAEPIVRMFPERFLLSLMALTVSVPMFTMRLLSEERRSGTMEMLLTAPVSETQVVLSKFLGVWLFNLLCYGLWLVFPLVLRMYGKEEFDYRPLMSFYLGLGCILANFLAMGVFCSSLTRSQIVAFLLTLAGMVLALLPFFVVLIMQNQPNASQGLIDAAEYMSFMQHLQPLQEGRVHLKVLVFHLSACVFWLFVTTRVLEARKWQ
jgi:ABC-type transport system involved in multi-copper enzyme maturation permease subunit